MSNVLQNAPFVEFCSTFDLHYVIIGLEKTFLVFLRVAVLHRFDCTSKVSWQILVKFHVKHHRVEGNAAYVFWAEWIGTLVAMALYMKWEKNFKSLL